MKRLCEHQNFTVLYETDVCPVCNITNLLFPNVCSGTDRISGWTLSSLPLTTEEIKRLNCPPTPEQVRERLSVKDNIPVMEGKVSGIIYDPDFENDKLGDLNDQSVEMQTPGAELPGDELPF